jgi:hypothetical protein
MLVWRGCEAQEIRRKATAGGSRVYTPEVTAVVEVIARVEVTFQSDC